MENDNKPMITIAITTYSRESLLRKTLDSVISQVFENFEIIVGNDNGDRRIEEVLKEYKDERIRWINHKKRKGYLANIESLLEVSNGRYITTLSDDDLMHPKYLEKVNKVITEYEDVNVIFTDYEQCDSYNYKNIAESNQTFVLKGNQWITKFSSKELETIGSYGVYKKDFYNKVGGLEALGIDTENSPYNDTLLALKAGTSEKVFYIPEKLVFFRNHEGSPSITRTDIEAFSTAQKDFIEIVKRMYDEGELEKNINELMISINKWFVGDYFCIVSRSKKFDLAETFKYIKDRLKTVRSVNGKFIICAIIIKKAIKAIAKGMTRKA